MLVHRQDKREPLLWRALWIFETSPHASQRDVAGGLQELGGCLMDCRKFEAAEPLLKRAVDREQARYDESETLLKRSLAIREKVLGPDHPRVADSLKSLAELDQAQMKFASAEARLTRALAIQEKCSGADDPDVADTLDDLAELLTKAGRPQDAKPLTTRADAIRRRAGTVRVPRDP